MQWIFEHQNMLWVATASAVAAGSVAAGWMRQRQAMALQRLQQQVESEQALHHSEMQQLRQTLQSAQDELHELDAARDQGAYELRQTHGKLMVAIEKLRQFDTVKKQKQHLDEEMASTKEAKFSLEAQLREQQARYDMQHSADQEKLQLLESAEERLTQQFERLAQQLFDEKSAKVDQQNRQSLDSLLSPLKVQLEGFKKQVNDNFNHEAKERHTLVHELKNLQRLNEQMAQEAVNLTNALKGDNKAQGNWGEVILASILDDSGLREGHEYLTQVSLHNEAGKRYQPDVIVNLPQQKQVVVDSKVTLVAYERYYNATDDMAKERALQQHLAALRAHIRGLSQKDYHRLDGIQCLDYVLLFVPIEPAFQVAIQAEPSLVKEAMEQNILLVSPTTLLVALSTIENLWRNERKNQNAQLIADKASKLYDKLRLFVDDMEGLGGALDRANQSYQGAMNKLATGRGNVLRQAESFTELGVQVKKPISPRLTESMSMPEESSR